VGAGAEVGADVFADGFEVPPDVEDAGDRVLDLFWPDFALAALSPPPPPSALARAFHAMMEQHELDERATIVAAMATYISTSPQFRTHFLRRVF
jgi:hypothetical protein